MAQVYDDGEDFSDEEEIVEVIGGSPPVIGFLLGLFADQEEGEGEEEEEEEEEEEWSDDEGAGAAWPVLFGAVAFKDLPAVEAALQEPQRLRAGEVAAALHMAAACNFDTAVPLLLGAGAPLNDTSTAWGAFARDMDSKTQELARVDLLYRRNAWTPLEQAAWRGHLATVQALLGAGARLGSAHLAALDGLLQGGHRADSQPPAAARPMLLAMAEAAQKAASAASAVAAGPVGPQGWVQVAAAADEKQWDASALGSALLAIEHGWRAKDLSFRDTLRSLLKLHCERAFGGHNDSARLLDMRPPALLTYTPIMQLWCAAPVLCRLPLMDHTMLACEHGAHDVLEWLLARAPMQAALRAAAGWEQTWRQQYEAWQQADPQQRGRLPYSDLRACQPDPAAHLVACASAKQGVGSALSRVLAAGAPLSIHSINRVITLSWLDAGAAERGLQRLQAAAGPLPRVPVKLAYPGWDPIFHCLGHHMYQQQQLRYYAIYTQRQDFHDRCLAVMEAVVAAGYRPTRQFQSAVMADGSLQHDYSPLTAPLAAWDVSGKNRWLWLAGWQTRWSPETHARFPPALHAAARTLLLVASRKPGPARVVSMRCPGSRAVMLLKRKKPAPPPNRLPKELVFHILEVAAYPLSCWAPQLLQ